MATNKYMYTCKICEYSTHKKDHYTKHLNTLIHLKKSHPEYNITKNKPIIKYYTCEKCGKNYKDPSGLWRHNKKICNYESISDTPTLTNSDLDKSVSDIISKEFLLEICKQNASFQNLLLEQSKMMMSMAQNSMIQNNTCINNNSNNNSNNKTFNLQFFLNEQCKDAMTLQDFVNSLKIGVEELEATGRLGFVEGISNIIVNGLNKLDIYKRPIHCTDLKREVMYVKIFKGWEKDADGKPIVAKTVRSVIDKNFSNLKAWQELNPQYDKFDTKTHENYMNIVCNCLPGSSVEDCEINMDKVIKNIAKKTVINKQEVMNDLNNM
jgi:Zinc finger, C2H2 type